MSPAQIVDSAWQQAFEENKEALKDVPVPQPPTIRNLCKVPAFQRVVFRARNLHYQLSQQQLPTSSP